MSSFPEQLLHRLKAARWRRLLQARTTDSALTARLMELGIVADRVQPSPTGLTVSVPGIDLPLHLPGELFVLEAPAEVAALLQAGGHFLRATGGELRVRIDGIELEPTNAEELLILREIFADGVYNCLPSRPTVVWDIGGNVGVASLFFSRLPQVLQVHAFEPLAENRRRAEHHYALNPALASRITQHPHAVGRAASSLQADYAPNQRGSFSITHAPEAITRLAGARLQETRHETISLVPAVETLGELRRSHPQADVLVKMDCEGAENEILPALADGGVLTSIRTLLIETHHGYGPGLARLLHEAGFEVLLHAPHSRDLGYLFAFNRMTAGK